MSDASSTAVQPYEFNGNLIRVVMIDGEPWFISTDVCEPLALREDNVLSGLDHDEKKSCAVGDLAVWVISESGLYSTIMRSRKPEAKAFKRWVTGEVLPQIRKTGSYGVQRELSRRELAEKILAAEIEREEAEQRAELWEDRARGERAKVEAAAPKVEAYDELIDADGDYSLARAGQILKIGRDDFIAHLARLGLIINRPGHSDHLRPYMPQVRAGRFVVKARTFRVTSRTSGEEETRTEGTTYVTPKGLTHIRQLLHASRPADDGRLL